MQIIWKKTIFPLKQYVSILWVATVFWIVVSYPPKINLGYFKQIMRTIWKNYLSPKTTYLHIRDIRKFTLSLGLISSLYPFFSGIGEVKKFY